MKTIDAIVPWFVHVKTIVLIRRVRNESLKMKSATWVFPCGRRQAATERGESIERRRQVTATSSQTRSLELGDTSGENSFDKGEQPDGCGCEKDCLRVEHF